MSDTEKAPSKDGAFSVAGRVTALEAAALSMTVPRTAKQSVTGDDGGEFGGYRGDVSTPARGSLHRVMDGEAEGEE